MRWFAVFPAGIVTACLLVSVTLSRPLPSRDTSISADDFLEKFGYLPRVPGEPQHSPAARKAAIRKFQEFNHLSVTGVLDKETREQMVKPRCGNPDFYQNEVNPGLENPQQYHVPGYKWKKNTLKWLARNYSPDMPVGGQRRAFYQAFDHWRKVTPLEFRELASGDPDIEIKFASYEHGDGQYNAFDGRGGTLAHAYFPENGGTHFDESETWTEYTREGTNLMIVAAHEFGHALGLGHSSTIGALMAPYYQGYNPDFRLHWDDIRAIQTLYGGRAPPTPEPPQPTLPSATRTGEPQPTMPATTRSGQQPPDTCTTTYDAVMQAPDNKIYMFKGKWMWSATTRGVEEGYPKLISDNYKSPPEDMGAAVYSHRTGRTYFFKDQYVWKYLGYERESLTRMTDPNYPSHPEAATMGRDGRIYLLKGDYYHIFDEDTEQLLNIGQRRVVGLWWGLPKNMEAAVRLRNDGYVYFFKGTQYWKYDEEARKVMDGYPRDTAPAWMGPICNRGRSVPK